MSVRHACFFSLGAVNAARSKRSTGGTTFGRYIKLMRICPWRQGKDQMRTALTVAGSDSGAGVVIRTDIIPVAVKTGMVSSSRLIKTVASKLRQYGPRSIVADPVMAAAGGARLSSKEAIGTLKKELFPLTAVITPDIPEAEVLSEMTITFNPAKGYGE